MKKIEFFKHILAVSIMMNAITLPLYAHSNSINSINQDKSFKASINKTMNTRKYILGPNDVFNIAILNLPNYKGEAVRVQPDGKIVMSMIGSIDVAGLTIDEFRELLIKKLSDYITNPLISIYLAQSKPFVAHVSGAVINPGSYEINTITGISGNNNYDKPDLSIDRKTPLLSNIILTAGGIEYDADIEHIKVVNQYDHSEVEVNLFDMLEGNKTANDIYLATGDSVYVPRLPSPLSIDENKYRIYSKSSLFPKTIPVKVYGYVNNPGLVKLDSSLSSNLNSAISSAGGYLRDSAYSPSKIFISRSDGNGKLVSKAVNPMTCDAIIMPNDIIYVPEKARPLAGKTFDYIARVIMPFSVLSNTYNNWALMFNPLRYNVIGK